MAAASATLAAATLAAADLAAVASAAADLVAADLATTLHMERWVARDSLAITAIEQSPSHKLPLSGQVTAAPHVDIQQRLRLQATV